MNGISYFITKFLDNLADLELETAIDYYDTTYNKPLIREKDASKK